MESEFDLLLERLPSIAKAVNAFSSEKVQERAFEALLTTLHGHDEHKVGGSTPKRLKSPQKLTTGNKPGPEGKRSVQRKQKSETGSIVTDLNLRPKNGHSLQRMIETKAPKTNEQHFAVMIYYLQRQLSVKNITVDHIYTCFKDIGKKVPSRLATVLSNTAHKKGWFLSPAEGLSLTTHGENFVEHDLPLDKEKS